MSKAKTPAKVLRTALKRLQKGWTKGTVYSGPGYPQIVIIDGKLAVQDKVAVCLRGAVHGYQGQIQTPATIFADKAILVSINELFPNDGKKWRSLPEFNDDKKTTFPMVEEVTKMALIKVETGWKP